MILKLSQCVGNFIYIFSIPYLEAYRQKLQLSLEKYTDMEEGNTTINFVKKLGWQLYLINPYEHMYENMEDLPKSNYLNQVCIRLEYILILILLYSVKRLYPLQNSKLFLIVEFSRSQYLPDLFYWRS